MSDKVIPTTAVRVEFYDNVTKRPYVCEYKFDGDVYAVMPAIEHMFRALIWELCGDRPGKAKNE
jgi:hypothetical protein